MTLTASLLAWIDMSVQQATCINPNRILKFISATRKAMELRQSRIDYLVRVPTSLKPLIVFSNTLCNLCTQAGSACHKKFFTFRVVYSILQPITYTLY
jgi:hypothetical protein